MMLAAFFYSPTMDSIPATRFGTSNIKLAIHSITEMFDRNASKNDNKHRAADRIDHNHIMSKFYEQEMPELTKASIHDLEKHHRAFDTSLDENEDDDIEAFNTSASGRQGQRRRELKKTQ